MENRIFIREEGLPCGKDTDHERQPAMEPGSHGSLSHPAASPHRFKPGASGDASPDWRALSPRATGKKGIVRYIREEVIA
jgi:hypothetical protein